MLTLMAETAIDEPDQVTVDGRDYEVTVVPRQRPGLAVVRRVEVREAG